MSNEITNNLSSNPFYFRHSVQSVRFLDKLEGQYDVPGGKSLNLTLQVLDGILCHDGEDPQISIQPDRTKKWGEFDKEIAKKMDNKNIFIQPMTLEGCLVRFVDVIAYLGRDIEDAIAIGMLSRNSMLDISGTSNRDIVNNLVMDIIENSRDKDEISYSEEMFKKLKKLLKFNYENIYNNPLIKTQKEKIKDMFRFTYDKLLSHIRTNVKDSPVFLDHINLIDRNDSKNVIFKVILLKLL